MEKREKILSGLAHAVNTARRDAGMSIRQLAIAADLEYSLVQRISKGKVNIQFSTLIALIEALNMRPEEFFARYEVVE